MRETLEEKGMEPGMEKTGRAEKLVNDKLAASKDGMISLNDAEFRMLIEAMKEEQTGKSDTGERRQVGVNVDLKI